MKNFTQTAGERRQFWRASFSAPAQLTLPSGAYAAELLDISLKGALLQLSAGVSVANAQTCRLRLPLSDDDETAIVMQGTVSHVNDGRLIGLRCDAIDVDSITHLRRLVELNAGDPALLERELAALLKD